MNAGWSTICDELGPDAPEVPRVCIVGPLPPPSGGMANQAEQLVRLLKGEGVPVLMVQTNAPCWPAWIEAVPLVRAFARMLPYVARLWAAVGSADVAHVFANSGWAFHLFVTPALIIARFRNVPVIVNYRGGNAATFFQTAPSYVLRFLGQVEMRVTPSAYLQRVFANFGLSATVIPNIIDLARFEFSPGRSFGLAPKIVVTRNLEAIYDIPTAIRAFARVRQVFPKASLVIAGSGPERDPLQKLSKVLVPDAPVKFTGRVDNADMQSLYADADCLINPSRVDNMPNSILEAFASGVPVVSTNAGGIPDMVTDGVSALLAPVGDDAALASHVLRVLQNSAVASALREAGLAEAKKYAWHEVKRSWLDAYRLAASRKVTR